MAGPGSSMLYSFLLFTVILSLQQMYRGQLASTELFTILGGFISSLLFLVLLTVSSESQIDVAMCILDYEIICGVTNCVNTKVYTNILAAKTYLIVCFGY